jgi:glycosyltransferase involved in cell wall biosynthesis
MRVLVISNLYPPEWLGGYELSCQQVVEGLRRRGHEVVVLTTATQYAAEPEAPNIRRRLHLADIYREVKIGGVSPHFQTIAHESRVSSYFNIFQFLKLHQEWQPEIIYLFNPMGLGIMGLIDAFDCLGAPWIWHLGDRIPADTFWDVSLAVRTLFTCGQSKDFSTGRFITVSRRLEREIIETGVTLGDRVHHIPNWGQAGAICPPRPERPDGPARFISAGSIGAHKGTDLIIEAAALLVQRGHRDFTVDFYGPGQTSDFCVLARDRDVENQIRFHGPKSQAALYALYACYDAFLFPTRIGEPFGLVPVEAATVGCPPILTYGCGAAEWFVHGVDCLKIRRQAGDLAQAMEAIMTNPSLSRTLGRRARNLALTSLNFERALTRIEAVLEQERRVIEWDAINWAEQHRIAYAKDRLAMHFFVKGY